MDALTNQSASAALTITNAAGQPAAVDGVPVWASSDETVLRVTASADGMSALIETVAPGTAHIAVTADADVGTGVAPIIGVTDDVTVAVNPASMASVVTITLAGFSNPQP